MLFDKDHQHELVKKYYWQLSKFTQREKTKYKEMKQPPTRDLYIYKEGHTDVIVRLINPVENIQGWRCKLIEILQKKNDNPRVFHWKSQTIKYKGELIPSLLENFNYFLNQ